MLDGVEYNLANQMFRRFTNQQQLMVQKALEWSRTLDGAGEHSFTAYGCGFGMFELEFLRRLPTKPVSLVGVDVNPEALADLREAVEREPGINLVGLEHCSTEDAVERTPVTRYGLSVQALFYHERQVAKTILKAWANRHVSTFVAITPLNQLNQWFHRMLTAEGVREVAFADDVQWLLEELGIEHTRERLPAVITLPPDVTDDQLRLFVSFVSHSSVVRTTRAALLDQVGEMGAEETGNGALVVPHPVDIFTL